MEVRHQYWALVMTAAAAFSRLIFGSMRMHERELSPAAWTDFLAQLYTQGIDTFHSSSEYGSFEIFCRVIRELKTQHGVQPKHMVKLAVPHFGEEAFDAALLRRRVDEYCVALGIERIDCMQWMWRSDLKEDAVRCEKFSAAAAELAGAMQALKSQGRVGQIGCFPYTPAFAALALQEKWLDCLVIYRNPLEQQYDALLSAALDAGKSVIALRPFAAGRVFSESNYSPRTALDYCFTHRAVQSAVVTLSSPEHFASVQDFVR